MNDSIGSYIRDEVIPPEVSVSEAARRLGVSRPALSNLLNGNATLSREMAQKLERVFGANANDLLQRQAEAEEKGRRVDIEARTARQLAAGYLKITATDIDHWASRIEARTLLPVLLRRLVHADTDAGTKVDFPGYDAGERKGWDGLTEAPYAGHWVPAGRTGWELSVSGDLPGKPNRDFQARAKAAVAEGAHTCFVFATARHFPGKAAWAAKQRQLGLWHDVRAYDAEDLAQWLERSATTQLWFANELGRKPDGVVPIAECWRRWSESTTPKLSPLLFEEAIADRRQTLVNWIDGEGELPFVLVADSADEALAFLALALRNPDGGAGVLQDRAVLAYGADALHRIAAASHDAILVTADRETELAAASLTRRNRVIVVRPRTSVENDADLALETPSEECFASALRDMGIDDHRLDQLRIESGLSPTILRRRLALTPELRLPKWASDKSLLRKMMPMLLAGAWNSTVPADQMLVADLADKPFEEVEDDLVDLLALAEAPVWAVGNYRGLVSRKDALFTAGSALTQGDIDRFFEVAEFILSEDDPALDLAPEDRWQANIYGKKRDISSSMRAAVGELLVLLAVYGDRTLGPHVHPVGVRVDALVSKLLRGVEERAWLSQQADLPLLAEASPRAFLEAIELDLRSDHPKLLAMLRPIDSGMFDSPDRTGLLWGLEAIAWDETYLFRVARILARLSEVPINDNWVNKPESSLESLVRSWLPQTSADIEQRLKLLDMIVREFPGVGWRLCHEQIDTNHRAASPNSKPRWRTDAAGAGGVTYDEDFRIRRRALDLMLAWPFLDRSQLADLISVSADFTNEDQDKVWSRVEDWIASDQSDEDRAELREHMRRSVLARRNQKKRKTDRLAKRRRAIYEALQPRDLVDRHRWLFGEDWVSESGDEIFDDDFDFQKHDKRVDGLRRDAMTELVAAEGLEGVGRMLAGSSAWGTIGRYLYLASPESERHDLIGKLVARAMSERLWAGALQGALIFAGEDERADILATLGRELSDAEALTLFRYSPFEGATWRAVHRMRPALERGYWREVAPYGGRHSEAELGILIERLLEVDRPMSAFNAISFDYDKVEGAMLARLMKAVVGPTSEDAGNVRLVARHIERALDALEAKKAASVAELAQYEYLFLNALTRTKHGIRNLEKQIEQSPADFVHLVSLVFRRDDGEDDALTATVAPPQEGVIENAYRALRELRRTPGTLADDRVDAGRLMAWLVDVRDRFKAAGRTEIGDGQIGALLGRSKPGSDGIWPGEAVRDALEACGTPRMLSSMEISLFNSRGATWRGAGGGAERTLAEKYRAYGRHLQADYPVSAQLLDSVARMWESHAEWHDTDEAVRQRLRR